MTIEGCLWIQVRYQHSGRFPYLIEPYRTYCLSHTHRTRATAEWYRCGL